MRRIKVNLYKIANQYQEILSHTFDEETGEILPQMLDKMTEISSSLEEKALAVASYIKNVNAECEAIEKAQEEMMKRGLMMQKKVNYLRDYLKSNMERCGINEIKSPYFVIKLKKCPISTEIFDENNIPNDYKKVKEVVTIDRTKLKEEMLAGVVVPGAQLKQNNRLEIK